jgi:hypothetical protein
MTRHYRKSHGKTGFGRSPQPYLMTGYQQASVNQAPHAPNCSVQIPASSTRTRTSPSLHLSHKTLSTWQAASENSREARSPIIRATSLMAARLMPAPLSNVRLLLTFKGENDCDKLLPSPSKPALARLSPESPLTLTLSLAAADVRKKTTSALPSMARSVLSKRWRSRASSVLV